MKKILVLIILLCPLVLSAQTAKLAWDEAAPSLVEASSYTYKAYVGASTTGIVLTNVVCVVTTTTGIFSCSITAPAVFVGNGIRLTASNTIGESAKSANYPFPNLPAVPVNLRAE